MSSIWRVSEGINDPHYTVYFSAQEASNALRKIIRECQSIDGAQIDIEESNDVVSGITVHVPGIQSRRIFAEEWSRERAEYIRQCEEGNRLWKSFFDGGFNPSFIAIWNPASIKETLADDYEVQISDEAGTDLYLVLAPMIADIMQDANERVAERMIEVLGEFANKADGCPPEML